MGREIRFARSADGTRIAYNIVGSGPPLVCAMPNPSSIEADEEFPPARDFWRQLAAAHTLIRIDQRGVGASQREPAGWSLEALACDIAAVADAADLERFALFSAFAFGAAAVVFAADAPERVTQLALYGVVARVERHHDAEWRAFEQMARANPQLASRLSGETLLPDGSAEQVRALARISRVVMSVEAQQQMRELMFRVDITAALARVRAPVLMMGTRNSWQTPVDALREAAATISDARLSIIEGASDFFFLYADQIVPMLLDVFGARPLGASDSPRGAPVTVLFTDIEGNPDIPRQLGDEGWRALLREYERMTLAAIAAHGGQALKNTGDGFMASFPSAVSAVQCAIDLQRAIAEVNAETTTPVRVRIGINAGEPIAEGGDLFGTAVTLASRVTGQAAGGEILVSHVVRELCAGRQLAFADRGLVVVKGFTDPVRLFEVRWQV